MVWNYKLSKTSIFKSIFINKKKVEFEKEKLQKGVTK